MNVALVSLVLGLWVLGSVPVSLAVAGRMRGVAAREARTHRGASSARAHRVGRPPREFRVPGETRSLAQLRTRLAFSGLGEARTVRADRTPRGRRRLRRREIRSVA